MTKERENKLTHIATFSKSDVRANKAMKLLRQIDLTYHWCYDWDGLAICGSDMEATCCTCGITAIELWNDKKFLEKRYQEQVDYLKELKKRDIGIRRFQELETKRSWCSDENDK